MPAFSCVSRLDSSRNTRISFSSSRVLPGTEGQSSPASGQRRSVGWRRRRCSCGCTGPLAALEPCPQPPPALDVLRGHRLELLGQLVARLLPVAENFGLHRCRHPAKAGRPPGWRSGAAGTLLGLALVFRWRSTSLAACSLVRPSVDREELAAGVIGREKWQRGACISASSCTRGCTNSPQQLP